MTTVYLADLTHTTITVSSDAFPLNVGMVGAFAKKQFPEVDIELFKYPDDLKRAIKNNLPDVIGVSNYPWNLSLGTSFLNYVKRLNPDVIAVMGGPNMNYDAGQQARFLKQRAHCLDFYCIYEGETSFAQLLEAAFANGSDLRAMKAGLVPGNLYLRDGEMVKPSFIPRARALDDFPSPYQTGLFDKFFDGVLSPMIETHRGCPYHCTYCHEGHSTYNKINQFSLDRILGDLDYIADHVGHKVKNMLIADPNFGVFPNHVDIARKIAQCHDRSGFPSTVFATTAKNISDRIIEIAETFDRVSMPIWMSVQSMTEDVLKKIKRFNIKTSTMLDVQHKLAEAHATTKSELILGLPGETFETHVQSIVKLMEIGIDLVVCYQLMMVNGSEMREDLALAKEERFGTKFRVLPRSFHDDDDIGHSIETEEIVTSTRGISETEYLKARQLHLLVSIFYTGKAFKGFFNLLGEHGISIEKFLFALLDRFNANEDLGWLNERFCADTQDELFDSEEELLAHYAERENFDRLLAGEVGGNLLQIYTCIAYMEKPLALVDLIAEAVLCCRPDDDELAAQVKDVSTYYTLCFKDFLTPGRCDIVHQGRFDFDVHGWLADGGRLADRRIAASKLVRFGTNPEQFERIESYFERYGRDAQAFGKITTRLWVYEMFRQPFADCESDSTGVPVAHAA